MTEEKKTEAGTVPQNKKSKLHILKRLIKYVFEYKLLLFAAFVLMIVSNLLALVGPQLSGKAIDAIELGPGNVDFDTVFLYCGLMAAFYALSSLLSYVLSVVMTFLSRRVSARLRSELFNKLMTLPVKYFDKTQPGDIISRISYDIDTINTSISTDILQICSSVITIIGALIMMIMISPPLVLVFAVTVPMAIVFTCYKSKKIHPLFRRRSAKLGELNGYTEEILTGHRTIKAYRREDTMSERFDGYNDEAVEAYYHADYQGSMIGPTVNFINNLSLSFISAFGSILYIMGSISLGNISTFIMYSRKFSGPINEMANIISELQSAASAAERVFRIIDEEPELPDEKDAYLLDSPDGNVRAENVRFSYEEGREILHGISFEALKGKTVAIVGPTGSGKTTIINLLLRFYDIDSGSIKFDGHDVRGVTRDSLRSAYTMVLQDTWLFGGTVAENIAYGKEGASREEVVEAARAAMIDGFIEGLPDGYDTVITEDGINLSKGQKQLFTIARAMLPECVVLILDEATSNVDSRTERKIQAAMKKLMEGKTSFIIAHRLSTVQNADVILVVHDGIIEEAGTHDELLASGGFYASLYNSQFS
ncbi:MAG: ABC transporter ATP-binding protein/permease [Clostridiales bacterium]|nr:ABC transporter ATP-binding protein/permease [Clostridiales bacterium]